MAKVEAKPVPFCRFQPPFPQKFAAFTASSFRFHIPDYKLFDLSLSVVTKERLVYTNVYWGEEAKFSSISCLFILLADNQR